MVEITKWGPCISLNLVQWVTERCLAVCNIVRNLNKIGGIEFKTRFLGP